ncbi:MAG: tetratricopeptide repeat protein, partial [Coleofasciculaceae cyanobacterium]
AAEDESSAAELLASAERAMSDGDYAAGVARYVEAAAARDSVETARQATLVAFEFGFDALAVTAAQRWASLSAKPDDAGLFGALAQIRAGDTQAGGNQLAGIFDRATDADAVCGTIRESLLDGVRADHAAVVFGKLAKRFDELPCVLRLAVSAAISVRDYEAADNYFGRLSKIDAFDNDARLLKLTSLIQQDQGEAAFTDPDLYLDGSATARQQVELAFLNARAESTDNATILLEQLRLEYPNDVEVLEALALVYLQAGNVDMARRLFLEMLSSGKKTNNALYYLARFAERERRFDQAIRMYSQVDYGDLTVAAQRRAATLLTQRDDAAAGLAHLQQFVTRHPRYGLEISAMQASLYADDGDYAQALELYDAYLAIKPGAEFAMLARADVMLRDGRLDDAIKAFRAALAAYPKSANTLNALGYTLADRTRKLREAEKLIDRALALEPDNAAIIDSKGWVLFQRGKLKEAREYLERAWSMFQDPEVAAHLGETLWRLGEEDKARELLQEAWQRFPDDDTLRDTVQRLLEDGPATRS